MTEPLRIIRCRFGRVEFHPWGAMSFVKGLRDGVPATPHPDLPDYQEVTRRCGYGEDCLRFTQEHEVAHFLVEEFIHDRVSRVLWALARRYPPSRHEAAYEELAAQALQRFARTGERPIVAAPWYEMRDRFVELVDAA